MFKDFLAIYNTSVFTLLIAIITYIIPTKATREISKYSFMALTVTILIDVLCSYAGKRMAKKSIESVNEIGRLYSRILTGDSSKDDLSKWEKCIQMIPGMEHERNPYRVKFNKYLEIHYPERVDKYKIRMEAASMRERIVSILLRPTILTSTGIYTRDMSTVAPMWVIYLLSLSFSVFGWMSFYHSETNIWRSILTTIAAILYSVYHYFIIYTIPDGCADINKNAKVVYIHEYRRQ